MVKKLSIKNADITKATHKARVVEPNGVVSFLDDSVPINVIQPVAKLISTLRALSRNTKEWFGSWISVLATLR